MRRAVEALLCKLLVKYGGYILMDYDCVVACLDY